MRSFAKASVLVGCFLLFSMWVLQGCHEMPPDMYAYNEPEVSDGDSEWDGQLPSDMDQEGEGISGDEDSPLPDGDLDVIDSEKQPLVRCATLVSDDSVGDSWNRIAYSMAVFNDKLYVGTLNGEGGSVFSQRPNSTHGAEILVYDGQSWETVVTDGLQSPNNFAVSELVVHDGRLYAGTMNYVTGAEVWYTTDGSNWQLMADYGFGASENRAVASMMSYNGSLYVGTENPFGGGQILKWESGRFMTRVTGGFDNPSNTAISSMTEFLGYIFAGTTNVVAAELYRFDGVNYTQLVGLADVESVPPGHTSIEAMRLFKRNLVFTTGNQLTGFGVFYTKDGANFNKIGDDGFGDGRMSTGWALEIFDDTLMMGCMNQGALFSTYQQGAALYRSGNGLDYSQLVGEDDRWAPEGFGDERNYGFPSMAVYRDKLYLGTSQCFFCNGSEKPQIWMIESPSCR